jgi:uncharacterized protein
MTRIWAGSGLVVGRRWVDLIRRGAFVGRSLLVYQDVRRLLDARCDTVLGKLLQDRPETIGVLAWPYQCATWDVSTRLRRLADHCEAAGVLGKPFDFGVNDRIVLADLSSIRDGLKVVMDQPSWFMREGNLVLNLFVGRVRMYSLAFSLYRELGEFKAIVGAIQGRDVEGAIEEYKNLTKASHGMRPRDLLFEIFCMLCAEVGIRGALAVSDEARHHKHPYFKGRDAEKKSTANYNEVWEERGASRLDESFYSLDLSQRRRDLDSIPAKKRGMYRRRYEMLDGIRDDLTEKLRISKTSPAFEPHESFDL